EQDAGQDRLGPAEAGRLCGGRAGGRRTVPGAAAGRADAGGGAEGAGTAGRAWHPPSGRTGHGAAGDPARSLRRARYRHGAAGARGRRPPARAECPGEVARTRAHLRRGYRRPGGVAAGAGRALRADGRATSARGAGSEDGRAEAAQRGLPPDRPPAGPARRSHRRGAATPRHRRSAAQGGARTDRLATHPPPRRARRRARAAGVPARPVRHHTVRV
ncbi:MAG: DNA polymerase IV, partial [uncultured Thermomicrobiales bacterium]